MSAPAAPPSLAVRGGPSDPKGRSLHTTSPAPALSRLATYSSPILAVPTAAASATTCHYCLRASLPGDGQLSLLPCSACRVARYCSKACQRAAWKLVHKVECPALAAAPPGRVLPTPVRALIQVAARKDAWVAVGGGLVGNEAAFRSAGAGPWADLKVQGEMARVLAARAGAEGEWIGGGDVAGKFAVAMCKLLTNMFNVHDPDIGYDAVFLDGGLAMVNHSCLPNASAHIYGRTALLVADQPIAADEEITISYIDTSYPLAHRRQELEKYHFVCKCPRCHSDLNVYEAARLLPSAVAKANAFAITHDPDLSGPPTANNSATKGTKLQSTIYEALDALPEPAAADDRAHLRKQFDVCAPLVRDSLWAMLPQPLLTACLTYYLARGDHVEAFLVTCLSACRVHPYTHPSPANPHRLKGGLALCRALSNASADRSLFASRLRAIHARTRGDGAAPWAASPAAAAADIDVDVLVDLDAVATARMVFDMLAHYAPITQLEGWPLDLQIKQGLEAVRGIPWGVDGGIKVMEEWERREGGDEAWLGIWRRMVQLLDGMAELGARLLVVDFLS